MFAMHRFVSKRSSSSQNLAAPALDDVRGERAAIALSVGLSWPPERTKMRGRPSWQQLWERALQERILNHHELPHGILLQRPGWWRRGEAIYWPLTHEELACISTPRAAPAAPAVLNPSKEGQSWILRQRGHPGRHAGRSPSRRAVLPPATKHIVPAALRRGRLP